jgi:coenzyme PQQ synthesis protein D (PqqD)
LRPLSSNSVVARSDGFIEAEVDGEMIALSIERGTCYALNRVGSRIWGLLGGPLQIGDLCATLVREYRVAPDVCEREVLDLLEELRTEGLIATVDEK